MLSALAIGGGGALLMMPNANAADRSPEEIMGLCNDTEKLNGVTQSFPDISKSARSSTCDFEETNFETFDGPTEKVTPEFPNCEPDVNENSTVSVNWTHTTAQKRGTYTSIDQGGLANVFGALGGSWSKHKGTLDLKTESSSAGDTSEFSVPAGKVLHIEFTPKLQRMTGKWKVLIQHPPAVLGASRPDENYEAPDVVEGPVILPGAAGAPGVTDGKVTPVFVDC
ncbi:hypothetical protein ACIOWG_09260 [Streptomyces sp. NPDC087658]|uniref:hypothetical protein n=1 Tax=Streptomyces sp. NPDC087658 TaxID=3365800 RepID=UPI00381B87DC